MLYSWLFVDFKSNELVIHFRHLLTVGGVQVVVLILCAAQFRKAFFQPHCATAPSRAPSARLAWYLAAMVRCSNIDFHLPVAPDALAQRIMLADVAGVLHVPGTGYCGDD